MTLIYRQANPNSFEEIRQLFVTHEYSWRDSDPEGFVPKSEKQRDHTAKHFMAAYKKENPKVCGFAAFDGDKMVGSHQLEIYPIDGISACHIHGLWVDSNYRGMGIALKLKEMGESWAIKMKCEFMDSNVRVTNEGMIALNKKMGYEVARYNFRKKLSK